MRHRWLPSTVKAFVKCKHCGLEVRKYMLNRGGLGPCEPDKWKIKMHVEEVKRKALVTCPSCKKLVPNAVICLFCGHQLNPLGFNSRTGG